MMSVSRRWRHAALTALCTLSCSAGAGVIVDTRTAPHLPSRPGVIGVQEDRSALRPLTTVFKTIVPPDWKGFLRDQRIGLLRDDAWQSGGRPWPDELAAVLLAHGLSARLDWGRKEIEFDIPMPCVQARRAVRNTQK